MLGSWNFAVLELRMVSYVNKYVGIRFSLDESFDLAFVYDLKRLSRVVVAIAKLLKV